MSRRILAAIFLFSAALAGCAQDVGDINRVQPDYLKKTDFAGMWYLRDTVTRVPPTSSLLFAGYTGELEKIRWVITAKSLIAYRAYELIPGEDRNVDKAKAVNKTKVCDPLDGTRCTEYEGAPIAAYEITSHFDIQREYKPETGEQTNVIVENTEDRPWQERQFMRVNWSANQITNYTQLNSMLAKSGVVDLIRYVGQDSNEKNAVTIEHKADGAATYVDFTGRYYINPVDCFLGWVGPVNRCDQGRHTALSAASVARRTCVGRVSKRGEAYVLITLASRAG